MSGPAPGTAPGTYFRPPSGPPPDAGVLTGAGREREDGGAPAAAAAAGRAGPGSGSARRSRAAAASARRPRGGNGCGAAAGARAAPGPAAARAGGGRAGAGLRPGAAVPPAHPSAQGEPPDADESGGAEPGAELQHRQRAEKRGWGPAALRQEPGGILRPLRPAGALPPPGPRVPLAELRQRQTRPRPGAGGPQRRGGGRRDPALHPVPAPHQGPDRRRQGHPQCPAGGGQQDHWQVAPPRGTLSFWGGPQEAHGPSPPNIPRWIYGDLGGSWCPARGFEHGYGGPRGVFWGADPPRGGA